MNVVVGMSGGVDSSVAAALLKEQGHSVVGVTMKIFNGQAHAGDSSVGGCYGPDEEHDVRDAAAVAAKLSIPYYTFDLQAEYASVVLDYFKNEYKNGRTPNPCVRCNSRIKFGLLLEKAVESNIPCDFFATGHYARVERDANLKGALLKKAVYLKKDQSYFLCMLSQRQLARVLFPLGTLTKEEVRAIARKFDLLTADKVESQDFCSGDYRQTFDLASHSGDFVDAGGKILGQHRGISAYTIGQRKGLGIAAGKPLYVTRIDADANTVTLGGGEELLRTSLQASGFNWIAIDPPLS
ncbi:MAG: tRNA 2-thiouridine(34) synthase MnmA, partial [Chitinivibrionales bacterium]|nr:tRNA 2-thiouridine(34) synthase MnmA [Chitinivibrionales bacterium]